MTNISKIQLFTTRMKVVAENLTSLLGEKEFGNSGTTGKILSIIDSFNSNINSNKGIIDVNCSNLLTEDGKIRIALATSNDFKKKDFESYFAVNHFGSAIRDLFEVVTFDVVTDTDENVYSFKENAQGKALANTIPNTYIIGDDSGIVLPEMSMLLNELRNVLFDEQDKTLDVRSNSMVNYVDNTLLPGVVSKRFSTDEVVNGIAQLLGGTEDPSMIIEQLTGWKDQINEHGQPISVSTQNIFVIAAFADLINLINPMEEFGIIDEHIADHVAVLQSTLEGVITDEEGNPIFRHDVTSGISGELRLPKLPRHIAGNLALQDEYFKRNESHAYNAMFWLSEQRKFLGDMSIAERSQIDHRGDAFGSLMTELLCTMIPFNNEPFIAKVDERLAKSLSGHPVSTLGDLLSLGISHLVLQSSMVSLYFQEIEEADTSVILDYDDGSYYKTIDLDSPVKVIDDTLFEVDGDIFSAEMTTTLKLVQISSSFDNEQTLSSSEENLTVEILISKASNFTAVHSGTTIYPQYDDESGDYKFENDSGEVLFTASPSDTFERVEEGIIKLKGMELRAYMSTLVNF